MGWVAEFYVQNPSTPSEHPICV